MRTILEPKFDRRAVTLGLGTAALAAGVLPARATTDSGSTILDAMMQSCIDECQKCHVTCLSMATGFCLLKGGVHATQAHIRTMLDCAQICATTADFMARGSAHHVAICQLCADICDACARSCTGMAGMETCLATCRACAKSCRDMAKMG